MVLKRAGFRRSNGPTRRRVLVKKKIGKGNVRAKADQILAQGTGRAVGRAFGASKSNIPRQLGLANGCWDAFNSFHAPLPRSVGPYTVVRTTRMFSTTAKTLLFGTFEVTSPGTSNSGPYWSNVVCAADDGVGIIGSTAATKFWVTTTPGGNALTPDDSTFTCCPAAISVQMIGVSSLQTSAGQIASAVVPARLDLADDGRTWLQVASAAVAYFRPRLMSGGKIALRGVQMDSHPLSMAEISEFLPMRPRSDSAAAETWTGAFTPHPRGWAPMVVMNPDGANLAFIVSVEWRVRFDMSEPAVASHSHHGVSSDIAWDRHIQRASALLPGVIDIIDKVANTGMAAYRAAGAMGMMGA